jgi:primosomal protein N' (replication factor Y)
MVTFCEVVVNRPIRRHRVIPELDYPKERDRKEDGEATNPLDVTFSYAIPEDLRQQAALGQLVEVPFRNGTLQGVIVGLSGTPPPIVDTRPITSILDPTPALTSVQIALAHWLSARYLAHISRCIWLFIPPGMLRPLQNVVEAMGDKEPPPDLDARAHAMLLYLRGRQEPTPISDLEAEPLKTLCDIELVRTRQRLAPPRVGPQIDRTVELIATPEEISIVLPTLGRASKQANVLLHLAALDDPVPTLDDVLGAVGCTASPVQALSERGWIKVTPRRTMVVSTLSSSSMEAALADLGRAPAQRAALASLHQRPGPVEINQLGTPSTTLAKLEAKGYVRRWTEPATITLTLEPDELLDAVLDLRGATKHAEALDLLTREEGRVWVGWVYAQTDANLDTLRSLSEAGLVALDEARRWRDPLADQSFVLEHPPQLTPDQDTVWRTIRKAMGESANQQRSGKQLHSDRPTYQPASPPPTSQTSPFLLHGVTGSGKTEIYLRAVAEALGRDKRALVLVPEIALAAQTVRRVVARFPGKVAVWHSDLSLGERFDTWQRVRDGELSVVVGARSALFAPMPNLGLIVVDEEHEPAYKSSSSPRYHAREVAVELGRLTGATVILGSATPDVTTFRRAEGGAVTLLTLPKRVLAHRQHVALQSRASNIRISSLAARPLDDLDRIPSPTHPPTVQAVLAEQGQAQGDDIRTLPLPQVEVVDLREELKAGNRTIFSRALQNAIHETLEADQQVILFLNRRGAATFVLCRDCGHVMRCLRCEMPLTFHAGDDALICHHCNRRHPNPDRCPVCESSRIRFFGVGTERVEATVRDMFSNARPLRWDLDTTRSRGSHTAFLQHFVDGRANVLVGTQMIAKGLDLPRVTLVGVISADTALYLPDFRAAERTFQLLTQVAGRAGRSPLGGRVILQTYNPDLPIIQAAAAHDYAAFYQGELAYRHESRYPPFKRLARLIFTGAGAERAQREAEHMAKGLRSYVARQGVPEVDIIGPAPCFYGRLRGQHRWHILVRSDEPEALLRPLTLPLGWRVDIDPIDLL